MTAKNRDERNASIRPDSLASWREEARPEAIHFDRTGYQDSQDQFDIRPVSCNPVTAVLAHPVFIARLSDKGGERTIEQRTGEVETR
jgi:hypothetical protein